ncbi:MAG: hypothetical protein FWH40_04780 [Coriobacteriia bacterium]|nr:hypothetical protein [Coriobacteriia bacterium]
MPLGEAETVGRRAATWASVASWASSTTKRSMVNPSPDDLVRAMNLTLPPFFSLISSRPSARFGLPWSSLARSGCLNTASRASNVSVAVFCWCAV